MNTFNDVTAMSGKDRSSSMNHLDAQAILKTMRHPFIVLDCDLVVQGANRAFYDTFDVEPEETEGHTIYDLGNGQWDIPKLRELLENILPHSGIVHDFLVEHRFETIGRRVMMINARQIPERNDVIPGQYVMITITDTGEGIEPDVMERIFEPFFTTKAVGVGSGLGLIMVYGFVKQSGGYIHVYSESDEGTSVKLYFPRATGAVASEQIPESGKKFIGGKERILVVEDDVLVREHLISQLLGFGYEVVGVGSGPEAIEVLSQSQPFDLLFTDIVMPGGMNGRELAKKALGMRPELKVLFTSGYTEQAIIHQGRLDPGVQLLSKPYRRQQLADKVRIVLNLE